MSKKKADEAVALPEPVATPPVVEEPVPGATAKAELPAPLEAGDNREALVAEVTAHLNAAAAGLKKLEQYHDRYARAGVRLAEAIGAVIR